MPFMENTGVPCTGTFFTLVYWTVPGETYFSLLYYSLPTIHFQMPFPVQNYHSSIVSLSLPRYVLKFAGGRQDVREPDAPGIRPSWKYLGNLWRKTSKIPEPTPVLFLMRRTEVAWASHRSISKWDGLLNKRENRWGYHACIAATETYMLFSTGHGSTFLPPHSFILYQKLVDMLRFVLKLSAKSNDFSLCCFSDWEEAHCHFSVCQTSSLAQSAPCNLLRLPPKID